MFLDDGFTTKRPRGGRDILAVSDLHLGAGEPSGFPRDLEPTLAALLTTAARSGSVIVLNGDVLDGGVADLGPRALLETAPRVRDALARAADEVDVFYVMGNHDPSRVEIERALGWTVVERLAFDDGTLFTHGHELDPGLRGTWLGRSADVLHRVERALGEDFEFPVNERSPLAARAVAAAGYRAAMAVERVMGDGPVRDALEASLTYVASIEEQRDPSFVLATLARCDLPAWVRRVVCGHTHHPGRAAVGDVDYVNLGTWSRRLATFATFRGPEVIVRDAVTGRDHGFEAYERWEQPVDWRAFRQRVGPKTERQVLREVADRVLGSAFRGSPRRAGLAYAGPSSLVPQAALRPGLGEPLAAAAEEAEEPSTEHRPARLELAEQMRGTLRLFGAKESAPVHLDLEAAVTLPTRARVAALRGRIDAEGLARARPATGTLTLAPDLCLTYEVHFEDDGGRALRLVGTKALRLTDLAASFRELPMALLDADGRALGEADLTFDFRADLGALIRSLRLVAPRAKEAVTTTQGLDPIARTIARAQRPRRVVVTGATGHLGYHLVAQLLAAGHEVTALVRSAPGSPRLAPLEALGALGAGDRLHLERADVLSPASLRGALAGASAVIHAAAGFHLAARDPEAQIVRPTIEGTVAVLRAAASAGVERVVMTSSVAALGLDARGREPLDERDWAPRALHPYHEAKRLAERRAWALAEETGLDLVVINPASFLGPNFFVQTPTTRMLTDLVLGRIPVVPPFRLAWVDVRDVAHAHLLALENPAAKGRYPLSARHASFEELLLQLAELDPDLELPRRRVPEPLAFLLPTVDRVRASLLGTPTTLPASLFADLAGKDTRVSSERARADLGWEPLPFDKSLADTVQWIRDHHDDHVST